MRTVLSLATCALTLFASPVAAQVLITEVQPNPDGLDSAEFIELQNTGATSVDIAGWTLNDFSGSSDPANESSTRWAFPAGSSIAGGEVIIVARRSLEDGFTAAWGRTPSYEAIVVSRDMDDATVPNMDPQTMGNPSPWALANGTSGDAVLLRDAMGNIVDGVEWGSLDRTVAGSPVSRAQSGESISRTGTAGSSDVDFIVTQPTPFVGLGAPSAPRFESVTTTPAQPRFGDNLTFTASVSDPDGVASVAIHLAVATSTAGAADAAYQAFDMTANAGAWTFGGQTENLGAGLGFGAPADFHSQYIRFWMVAEDTNTLTSKSPDDATAAADNTEFMWRNVMRADNETIADARRQGPMGRTRWLSHGVRVRGVALADGTFDPDRTYLPVDDSTGAIMVFDFAAPTVAVSPGDIVEVRGRINQFRGLTQLADPTIVVTGNTGTATITSVTIADLLTRAEELESRLVRIEDVDFDAPQENWSASGAGRGNNYTITDGTGTTTLRVWSGVGMDGSAAPQAGFHLTGVLAQRGALDDGYQIWPRGLGDIEAKAGPPMRDAGTNPASDAGTNPADTGESPRSDAAAGFDDATTGSSDAGVVTPQADTGTGGNNGGGAVKPPTDDGCSCNASAPANTTAGWMVLLLLGLALVSRRRVR